MQARASGYNYVMNEYSPSPGDWNDSGTIVQPHPTEFERNLCQQFIQVDSAGLRLIPHLQTGNIHAWFYHDIVNRKIPRQLIHRNLPFPADTPAPFYDSYVMSPDVSDSGAASMNNAFDLMWTTVFNAFKNAKSKMTYKNIDFVHLGYDENYCAWVDSAIDRFKVVPLVGLCGADTLWLKNNNLRYSSTEIQVQRLYAANIKQRVTQILSIAKKYHCQTKIMLWADMFDPYHTGGYSNLFSFKNLFDRALQSNDPGYDALGNLVKVRLVGILRQPDIKAVMDDLVLCPWAFDTMSVCGRYLPRNVIDTITSCGFKVLFACAGDEFHFTQRGGLPCYTACTKARYENALEFATAAHDSRFKSKVIGYLSAQWSDIRDVDKRQNSLIWSSDSNYVKPFLFMGILEKMNYHATQGFPR